MRSDQTLFGIAGAPDAREALVALAAWSGIRAKVYRSVPEYLGESDLSRPGCLVLDMSAANDNELLKEVAAHACCRPIVLIVDPNHKVTGIAKELLFDVIEKPFQPQLLLDCIHRALGCDLEIGI